MKLRFIVLFSLVLGCMLFTSCSYAWTFDEFLYFANSIKGENSYQSKAINTLIQYQDNVRTKIGNVNFTSFVCTNPNPNGGYCEFHFYLNPLQINSNNGQNIGFTYTDSNTANRDNLFSINYSTGVVTKTQWQSTSSWSVSSAFGLVETFNNFTNWGNSYFNNKWVAPYTGPVFTPSNNGSIEVIATNGVSENMIRLPFTYTGQSDWTLGYLTDYNEVYSIFGYFGPLFYREGQLYTESYQNEFNYNYYTGSLNSGLIFDPSTGRISIRRESLVNMQGYNLLLSYRLSSTDDIEEIDDLNYYAYFYNLSISSGDLVSSDINSTVDIGMINALDEFVNNNPNEQYYYDNSLFLSGDFWDVSGDIFGLSYRSYDNFGLHSFIKNTFTNFITFLSNNSNISINFGLLGIWNSSDFVMPQNAFTSLVSIVANGLLVLYAGFALYRFFNLISTFDLDALTNTDEVMNWF